MRPIKFRAKHYETRQWIYGAYVPASGSNHFPMIYTPDGNRHRVDENTVGEFTGLHGKKGEEIYEDDIGMCLGKIFIVVFKSGCYWCKRDGHHFELGLTPFNGKFHFIGNIHDNPELVKALEK